MKNSKVLGLAIVASLIAAPALAGETYVRNDDIKAFTVTKTDLTLDSTTNSLRLEKYASYADKTYTEGEVSKSYDYRTGTVSYDYGDGYTEHNAGSVLVGAYVEKNKTKLWGDIHSLSIEKLNSHETSAGVR